MIGRMPDRAEPSATPVMPFSAQGISITRSLPNFFSRPNVVPNTPFGSVTPNPMTYTDGSADMQSSVASWIA